VARTHTVAPTWRGPCPPMTAGHPRAWLVAIKKGKQLLAAAPLIGPALYWLIPADPCCSDALRRPLWMKPALLTPAANIEQQSIAPVTRCALRECCVLSAVDWMPPHMAGGWRQHGELG